MVTKRLGRFLMFSALVAGLSYCGQVGQDARVLELEEEVSTYSQQLDSVNQIMQGYESRIASLGSQLDTSRSANQTLVAALRSVTGTMNEYKRLFSEQEGLTAKLRKEVTQLKSERNRSTEEANKLRAKVEALDEELHAQRVRTARLEASLRASVDREALAQKALNQVLVLSGTESDLARMAYLEVKQQTIFTDRHRRIGFPPVSDAAVKRVSLGERITFGSDVRYLVDLHGKLKKGKSYTVEGASVTFVEPSMEGQRVLVVLK